MRLIVRSRPDGGQSPLCDVRARGAVSPILRPWPAICKTKPPGPPENRPEQARPTLSEEHLKRFRPRQTGKKTLRLGKVSLTLFSSEQAVGEGAFFAIY